MNRNFKKNENINYLILYPLFLDNSIFTKKICEISSFKIVSLPSCSRHLIVTLLELEMLGHLGHLFYLIITGIVLYIHFQ